MFLQQIICNPVWEEFVSEGITDKSYFTALLSLFFAHEYQT